MSLILTPMVLFELRSSEPRQLAERLKGYVERGTVYVNADSVLVKVFDLKEAALVRINVDRDDIQSEDHRISDEGERDCDAEYDFQHRVDGPAIIRVNRKGVIDEGFVLWDVNLRCEDHADAVAAGVADDRNAFGEWWSKRRRSLDRKGIEIPYSVQTRNPR